MAHAVDDDGDGGNVSDGSGHVGVATAKATVFSGDATVASCFVSYTF